MRIERAIDFQKISPILYRDLDSVGYNPDLKQMLHNIISMVTELSKLEVPMRRVHKLHVLNPKVEEINKAIKHLEQIIIMAKLML